MPEINPDSSRGVVEEFIRETKAFNESKKRYQDLKNLSNKTNKKQLLNKTGHVLEIIERDFENLSKQIGRSGATVEGVNKLKELTERYRENLDGYEDIINPDARKINAPIVELQNVLDLELVECDAQLKHFLDPIKAYPQTGIKNLDKVGKKLKSQKEALEKLLVEVRLKSVTAEQVSEQLNEINRRLEETRAMRRGVEALKVEHDTQYRDQIAKTKAELEEYNTLLDGFTHPQEHVMRSVALIKEYWGTLSQRNIDVTLKQIKSEMVPILKGIDEIEKQLRQDFVSKAEIALRLRPTDPRVNEDLYQELNRKCNALNEQLSELESKSLGELIELNQATVFNEIEEEFKTYSDEKHDMLLKTVVYKEAVDCVDAIEKEFNQELDKILKAPDGNNQHLLAIDSYLSGRLDLQGSEHGRGKAYTRLANQEEQELKEFVKVEIRKNKNIDNQRLIELLASEPTDPEEIALKQHVFKLNPGLIMLAEAYCSFSGTLKSHSELVLKFKKQVPFSEAELDKRCQIIETGFEKSVMKCFEHTSEAIHKYTSPKYTSPKKVGIDAVIQFFRKLLEGFCNLFKSKSKQRQRFFEEEEIANRLKKLLEGFPAPPAPPPQVAEAKP